MNSSFSFYEAISLAFGVYAFSVLLFYVMIAYFSVRETIEHLEKNSFTNYSLLASSNVTPALSIIAPAFNEELTIVENAKSLLNLYYNNYDVIIVNDGSRDASLQKLIDAYQLRRVDQPATSQLPTKKVKAIYKSTNPVFQRLVVADKENGGKADALNVGINVSNSPYFVCIDVDCILEQDALLRLMKPFLEDTDTTTIATGGVVRIANGCLVQDGNISQVNLPRAWLPRMQVLEYIRAFLLGRMAWSRLNGLLLISGAFGAFRRDIALKVGGYNTQTVGEDMELVVRMRRFMEEQNLRYRVAYIPDPLCWTEAPSSFKILGRQRNRWTRGTIETLWIHRKMFFNPRYGKMGLFSYPYWLFYECLAPLIEFSGFIIILLFAITGKIQWHYFFLLSLFIWAFAFLYSVFAILMEAVTYNQYKKRSEFFMLLWTALTEPLFYHPFIVWSAIRGNIDLLRRKKEWGDMSRKGFAPAAAKN